MAASLSSLFVALAVSLGPGASAAGPAEPAAEPAPVSVSVDEGAGEDEAQAGTYLIHDANEQPETAGFAPTSPLQFRAGAMVMTRAEFTRARDLESVGASSWALPVRLRSQLEARAGSLRFLAQLQDARIIREGAQSTRTGFHQLYFGHTTRLRRGRLAVRAGRQEYELGSNHVLGIAAWSPGMRSWDGLRVGFEGARGGVGVFGGSLARPLLSARQPLVDHLSDTVVVIGALTAHVRVVEGLDIGGFVLQEHRKIGGEVRNLSTFELRLTGEPVSGLHYRVEGDLQTGVIERLDLRQLHLAGHGFALLDYLAPEGLGPGKRLRPGGLLSLDYASGSACTTTEYAGLEPCTGGTNHDFDATWMRRHLWFGHADRFRAQNVIDTALGVHVVAQLGEELSLDLMATEHIFALAQPDGRWHDTSGARVGVDLDNRDRLVTNEVDLEAGLRYRFAHLRMGWMVVNNFAAGRALSGEQLRQFAYVQLGVDYWSSWR